MSEQFVSLLLATVISGICLSATMMGFWLTSRNDSFKLTWSLGVLVIVAHVIAYAFYAHHPTPMLGAAVVALLPVGLAIIHGAAHQFFERPAPLRRAFAASMFSLCLSMPPLLLGFDGLSFIIQNIAASVLLLMSGAVYWRHRSQATTALSLMTGVYVLAAISFFACGLTLALKGQWVLGGVADNWAERINIVVSIICMTAGGALAIALDQTRAAQRHKEEALTDPLTGLLNRRGLAHMNGERGFGAFAAVAVFDLDHFKDVNDGHGHAAGDFVLSRFATILDTGKGRHDLAVRLGGEEFALVMRRVTPEQAAARTRMVCARFGLEIFNFDGGFNCTASAGIGFGAEPKIGLDDVLQHADRALYAAKRAGRNRIEFDAQPAQRRMAG